MPRKLTFNPEEFHDLFYIRRLPSKEVSRILGIAVSTMDAYRQRNNLPARGVAFHPVFKRNVAWNKKYPDYLVCQECNVEFKTKAGHFHKYCSPKCYFSAKRNKRALSGGTFKSGDKHPNWNPDRKSVIYIQRLNVKDRILVYERDNHICQICGKTGILGHKKMNVDHKIAIALGGENTIENAWLLCHQCHVEKTREDKRKRKLFLYQSRILKMQINNS